MRYHAVAAVPLVIGSRVVAVVQLEFGRSRTFSTDDRNYLFVLGPRAAQALDRTWQYESAQRARAEAETLRARADRGARGAPADRAGAARERSASSNACGADKPPARADRRALGSRHGQGRRRSSRPAGQDRRGRDIGRGGAAHRASARRSRRCIPMSAASMRLAGSRVSGRDRPVRYPRRADAPARLHRIVRGVAAALLAIGIDRGRWRVRVVGNASTLRRRTGRSACWLFISRRR